MLHLILVYTACLLALILGLTFHMKSTVEGFQATTSTPIQAPPLSEEQLTIINSAINAKATEISNSLNDKVSSITRSIDDKNNDLASWAVTALY